MKSPKNIREVYPKCCATCNNLKYKNDIEKCNRPKGPEFYPEIDAQEAFFSVCDYWEKYKVGK